MNRYTLIITVMAVCIAVTVTTITLPYINTIANIISSIRDTTATLSTHIEDTLELFRRTHYKYYAFRNTMSDGPFSLDYMARVSHHIIIGKMKVSYMLEKLTPNLTMSMDRATLEVERDITGNYREKEIFFRTFPGRLTGVMHNDTVLVFIEKKEPAPPLSPFGNDYYLLMGKAGIYKIVDGKAYGYYYDGIDLEEFIKIIEDARSKRIKEITLNAELIVLGRISKIEPILLYPSQVDEKYILSSNIALEVEEELTGNYKEKEIVFFGMRDDIRCKVGDRCLVFLKYGTVERHQPMINKDKVAPYYNIYLEWFTDGSYKIKEDGKAYGDEFPEGIDVDTLVAKIKEYRSIIQHGMLKDGLN